MDTARYVVGLLLMLGLPPGIAWWFVVHPIAGFWRRRGVTLTMTVMGVFMVGGVAALWFVREALMGRDLGTNNVLAGLALVPLLGAIIINRKRRKYLTKRILAGIPEVSADDPGTLLTEGIYRRIRHPRYVEVTLAVLAYALFSNHLGPYVLFVLCFPLLHTVVLMEERELSQRFGEEHAAYRARVPRYLPLTTRD